MHNFESEIHHIWRPALGEIVQKAIQQRSDVVIKSYLPLDECNSADVSLIGRFLAINNYQVQFLVDSFDLAPTTSYPVSPECEYSFRVKIESGTGKNKMEYGGRCYIIDTELQKNNLPAGLLLKISMPSSIKRLRIHDRHDSQNILMPGLMLIDKAPVFDRKKLLSLLARYYQDHSRKKPEIINISAGGACLNTQDQHCTRFLGSDENYLFFFFSGKNDVLKCPHVFICKKVGLVRDNASRHTGLRIKFVRELIWEKPEDELKWRNVEAEGSVILKSLLEASPQTARD